MYDFYEQHCPHLPQAGCALDISVGCDCDIADAPLRGWWNGSGVTLLSSVDLGSRGLSGATLDSVQHDCAVYANSTDAMDMSLFADHEWIHSSVFFPSNGSVYALTHNEYHCDRPGCPLWPDVPAGMGFVTGVTLMVSLDGGRSWSHARAPPAHIVAVFPFAWNASLGATYGTLGFRSPSGILRAADGFYYASVTALWGSSALGQQAGACMMRTRDITDPASWLAWGGANGFNVSLSVSPWLHPDLDPAQHRCEPFTNTTYASLAWSSFYGRYIYFGTRDGDDDGGWWFGLSADLQTWDSWTIVDVPPGLLALDGAVTPPPPNASVPGRFIMRATNSSGAIWWEDAARTQRRPVGTCVPCPAIDACKSYVTIPDEEFDALTPAGQFACGCVGYNASGTSHYYYPTVMDGSAGAAGSPNFDLFGSNATLFLVAQRCVNAVYDGTRVVCSPFDINGLLVRDIVSVSVSFGGSPEAPRAGLAGF